MRNYTLACLAIVLSNPVNAQILKVDKAALDVDSADFFQGSVNLNFNLNNRSSTPESDVTFIGLKAQADVVYFTTLHAYILINSLDYFSVSDGPFVSTGYAHFRINFIRKRPVSIESFTQGQYDDGRNMPARFLQGTGLKFRIINKDQLKAFIGAGIMWEYEKWKKPDTENRFIEKKLFKNSDYVNVKYTVNDAVSFNCTAYYQGGFDAEDDVFRNRISLDMNLDVKLTQSLSFTTTFAIQYEDKPIIPINKYVYSLNNGLKLEF